MSRVQLPNNERSSVPHAWVLCAWVLRAWVLRGRVEAIVWNQSVLGCNAVACRAGLETSSEVADQGPTTY